MNSTCIVLAIVIMAVAMYMGADDKHGGHPKGPQW